MKPIALILAISDNNVIGTTDPNNPIPWRLPKDMNYFKKTTIGNGHNIVVMGRKTWDTIPVKYRPLDNRKNIVLSTTTDYVHNDAMVFKSKELLMDHLRTSTWQAKTFIAGGLKIYRQFMEEADELYLTRVHAEIEGDVVFDNLDLTQWEEVSSERYEADEKNQHAMTFYIYKKIVHTN